MLGHENIAWLAKRPFLIRGGSLIFAHGNVHRDGDALNAGFGYVFCPEDVKHVLSAVDGTGANIVFVGHTHEPALWRQPEYIKDEIVGLTYGVGPKLGRELLLVDPIETIVSNENVEEFIKLQKGYGDGFWHVVDYIVNQRESWFDRQNPQLSLECLRFANIMSKAKVSKVHLQALYQKLVKVLNVWWFTEKGGLALP